MSTIGRVGSVIKRAALYVPRRIASNIREIRRSRATVKALKGYHGSRININPHTGLEEHKLGDERMVRNVDIITRRRQVLGDERVVRKVENVQTLASSQVDIIARRKQVLGNEHKVRKVENLAPGIVLSDKYDTQNTSRYDMSENLYTQKPKTGILRGLWNNPALEIAMLRGYLKAYVRNLFGRNK